MNALRHRTRRAGSACSGTSAATTSPATTSSTSRSTERTTVLDALRWIQLHAGPVARAAALVLPRLVRHVRRARERPRGARVRDRARRPRGRHVTVEPLANLPVLNDLVVDMAPFMRAVPRRRTRSSAPASSCPRPTRPTTSTPTPVRGLHRVRALPVGVPGGGDRRHVRGPGRARVRRSGCSRRRAAPTARPCSTGPTARRAPGGATRRSSAPRPARRTSGPAQRIMALRKELGNRKKERS